MIMLLPSSSPASILTVVWKILFEGIGHNTDFPDIP